VLLEAVASEGASSLVVGSAARHGRVVTTPAGRAATVLAFLRHAPRLQGVSEGFTSPPLVWGGGGEHRAWP
jgi:hypothetical protein